MGRMKGNLKRTSPRIPGADDFHQPYDTKDLDRLAGNDTTYYDGQLRPGPRLRRPRKRGVRISRSRTQNDAAMAIRGAIAKREGSSGAGYSGKSPMRWFKGVGYGKRT